MPGHLFHVKPHLLNLPVATSSASRYWEARSWRRQRAICVMCSIKSAICATLLLCQMACSRVAKVWGLQRKSPGFRRAFNESFHAFGDIARKSFNVIHHERFKWKPSFSERFAKMVFCSIFFYKYGIFVAKICKQALYESSVGFYAVPERQPTSAREACSTIYILWHLSWIVFLDRWTSCLCLFLLLVLYPKRTEIGWQPRSWDDLYNCAMREAEAGWCAMCKIALQRPHIAIDGCSSAICNLQNFSKLKKYRYNWSKSRQHQYFQILLLVFLIQDQDLPSLYFAHFIHSSWPVWSVTSFVWTF